MPFHILVVLWPQVHCQSACVIFIADLRHSVDIGETHVSPTTVFSFRTVSIRLWYD